MYTSGSILTSLAPDRTFFNGYQLVQSDPLNAKKMFPKMVLVLAMQTCMVSMAAHNAVFKNWGVRTKLLISHLPLIIDY